MDRKGKKDLKFFSKKILQVEFNLLYLQPCYRSSLYN